MTRHLAAAALLVLATAGAASAGPITAGTWTVTEVPNLADHKSEDCATCAGIWTLPAGTEVLTAGFGYLDWPTAEYLGGITEYADAPGLSYDGLSFTYTNGYGTAFTAWDGYHFRLYRAVDAYGVTYWLHVEDLPAPIVPDWNDARWTWREGQRPPVPAPPAALLVALGVLAQRRWWYR